MMNTGATRTNSVELCLVLCTFYAKLCLILAFLLLFAIPSAYAEVCFLPGMTGCSVNPDFEKYEGQDSITCPNGSCSEQTCKDGFTSSQCSKCKWSADEAAKFLAINKSIDSTCVCYSCSCDICENPYKYCECGGKAVVGSFCKNKGYTHTTLPGDDSSVYNCYDIESCYDIEDGIAKYFYKYTEKTETSGYWVLNSNDICVYDDDCRHSTIKNSNCWNCGKCSNGKYKCEERSAETLRASGYKINGATCEAIPCAELSDGGLTLAECQNKLGAGDSCVKNNSHTASGEECYRVVNQCAGFNLKESEKQNFDENCYSCEKCTTEGGSKYLCTEKIKDGYKLVNGECIAEEKVTTCADLGLQNSKTYYDNSACDNKATSSQTCQEVKDTTDSKGNKCYELVTSGNNSGNGDISAKTCATLYAGTGYTVTASDYASKYKDTAPNGNTYYKCDKGGNDGNGKACYKCAQKSCSDLGYADTAKTDIVWKTTVSGYVSKNRYSSTPITTPYNTTCYALTENSVTCSTWGLYADKTTCQTQNSGYSCDETVTFTASDNSSKTISCYAKGSENKAQICIKITAKPSSTSDDYENVNVDVEIGDDDSWKTVAYNDGYEGELCTDLAEIDKADWFSRFSVEPTKDENLYSNKIAINIYKDDDGYKYENCNYDDGSCDESSAQSIPADRIINVKLVYTIGQQVESIGKCIFYMVDCNGLGNKNINLKFSDDGYETFTNLDKTSPCISKVTYNGTTLEKMTSENGSVPADYKGQYKAAFARINKTGSTTEGYYLCDSNLSDDGELWVGTREAYQLNFSGYATRVSALQNMCGTVGADAIEECKTIKAKATLNEEGMGYSESESRSRGNGEYAFGNYRFIPYSCNGAQQCDLTYNNVTKSRTFVFTDGYLTKVDNDLGEVTSFDENGNRLVSDTVYPYVQASISSTCEFICADGGTSQQNAYKAMQIYGFCSVEFDRSYKGSIQCPISCSARNASNLGRDFGATTTISPNGYGIWYAEISGSSNPYTIYNQSEQRLQSNVGNYSEYKYDENTGFIIGKHVSSSATVTGEVCPTKPNVTGIGSFGSFYTADYTSYDF
jgi:hypothetical protein